jgi:hypothetical protein
MALLEEGEEESVANIIKRKDNNKIERSEIATQHFEKPSKVSINHKKIGNLGMNFEECMEILQDKIEKRKYLEYNQENVEILLRGILTSPPSDQYPHPRIWGLFECMKEWISIDGKLCCHMGGQGSEGNQS